MVALRTQTVRVVVVRMAAVRVVALRTQTVRVLAVRMAACGGGGPGLSG